MKKAVCYDGINKNVNEVKILDSPLLDLCKIDFRLVSIEDRFSITRANQKINWQSKLMKAIQSDTNSNSES